MTEGPRKTGVGTGRESYAASGHWWLRPLCWIAGHSGHHVDIIHGGFRDRPCKRCGGK